MRQFSSHLLTHVILHEMLFSSKLHSLLYASVNPPKMPATLEIEVVETCVQQIHNVQCK